jgi:hypothetical protein
MRLFIEGDSDTGFHLVKAPEGFFTADDWFATRYEAISAAKRMFGVEEREWVVEMPDQTGGSSDS